MVSSGWSSLLYSSLVYFTLISIGRDWRSAHVIYPSRHHDTSPYRSMGQGKRLKFLCFLSAVKLPGFKIITSIFGVLVILSCL